MQLGTRNAVALLAGLLIGGFATYAFAAADNELTWDPTPGADTIHIERQDNFCSGGSAPWVEIQTIAAGTEKYTDLAVANPYDVCYRIAASNVHGKSGYSNEAGKVPGAPTSLTVP